MYSLSAQPAQVCHARASARYHEKAMMELRQAGVRSFVVGATKLGSKMIRPTTKLAPCRFLLGQHVHHDQLYQPSFPKRLLNPFSCVDSSFGRTGVDEVGSWGIDMKAAKHPTSHSCHKIERPLFSLDCARLTAFIRYAARRSYRTRIGWRTSTHSLTPLFIVLFPCFHLFAAHSHNACCHSSLAPVVTCCTSPISHLLIHFVYAIHNRPPKILSPITPSNTQLKSNCIHSDFSHEDSLLLCDSVLCQARGVAPPGCHVALAFGVARRASGDKGSP
jgi:hypothetical protein